MENIIIMVVVFVVSMIVKASRSNKNKTESKSIGSGKSSGKSVADELGDLFDVFDGTPKTSTRKTTAQTTVRRKVVKKKEHSFFEDFIDDREPEIVQVNRVEETSNVANEIRVVKEQTSDEKRSEKRESSKLLATMNAQKKKKKYRSFFDKIDDYNYIEKGVIYKEILGKPIAMR